MWAVLPRAFRRRQLIIMPHLNRKAAAGSSSVNTQSITLAGVFTISATQESLNCDRPEKFPYIPKAQQDLKSCGPTIRLGGGEKDNKPSCHLTCECVESQVWAPRKSHNLPPINRSGSKLCTGPNKREIQDFAKLWPSNPHTPPTPNQGIFEENTQ